MSHLPQLLAEVRRALVLRAVLAELVLWSAVLGTCALAIALVAPGLPRWPLLAVLVLAPIVGLVRARRTRPSDADVVTWIDRKLDADAAVITAWEIGEHAPAALEPTVAKASETLARAKRRDVRPRIARGDAWALPMACATFLASFLVPPPRAPIAAPGTDVVRTAGTEPLRRIERLPEQTHEPEQRRQLEEAARRARELRRDLEEGVERREALDRLEGVRLAVEAARPRPTPEQRRAQDAASEAMQGEQEMRHAVQERDLEALDRAVERAAARREAQDRERAREALRAAAEAARREGDAALAESLLQREELLQRRAEQAELARELMESMPELEGLGRALEQLERDGEGSELNREMVDAMREAWSRLSAEDRQRLADAMRRAPVAPSQARSGEQGEGGQPMSADEMERALREALANLDELQTQLGRGGMPMAGSGAGAGSGSGNGSGSGSASGNGSGAGSGSGSGNGSGAGSGTGGVGAGGGHVASEGSTRDLGTQGGPLARVRPRVGAGAPSRSTVEWIDPEGMDAPASSEGGATGSDVASGEQGAIERSPIPEDYRDHVREYFDGRR